jgi:hypothetical protein
MPHNAIRMITHVPLSKTDNTVCVYATGADYTLHTDSTGLADHIFCRSSSYFADNEGLEEPEAEH